MNEVYQNQGLQWGPWGPHSPGSLLNFHPSFPEEQKHGFLKISDLHLLFLEVPKEQNQAQFMLKFL